VDVGKENISDPVGDTMAARLSEGWLCERVRREVMMESTPANDEPSLVCGMVLSGLGVEEVISDPVGGVIVARSSRARERRGK
jgi:hypothetical protein